MPVYIGKLHVGLHPGDWYKYNSHRNYIVGLSKFSIFNMMICPKMIHCGWWTPIKNPRFTAIPTCSHIFAINFILGHMYINETCSFTCHPWSANIITRWPCWISSIISIYISIPLRGIHRSTAMDLTTTLFSLRHSLKLFKT